MEGDILLPFAYLPRIEWFLAAAQARCVLLDCHEHYQKQSIRTRATIAGANGIQHLIIPVQGRNHKTAIRDLKISYTENWQRYHRQAILSAYGSAAYFEHYFPPLEALLMKKCALLVDFLFPLIEWEMRSLKLDVKWACTNAFEHQENNAPFHNKGALEQYPPALKPYHQVFELKNGFLPALSAIDLLMNEGPMWRDYRVNPHPHTHP